LHRKGYIFEAAESGKGGFKTCQNPNHKESFGEKKFEKSGTTAGEGGVMNLNSGKKGKTKEVAAGGGASEVFTLGGVEGLQ